MPRGVIFYIARRFVNYAILSLVATCLAYVLASLRAGSR